MNRKEGIYFLTVPSCLKSILKKKNKNAFNDLMSDRQSKAAKLVDESFDPRKKDTQIDASFPYAKTKSL
jgi:hypothetical protein